MAETPMDVPQGGEAPRGGMRGDVESLHFLDVEAQAVPRAAYTVRGLAIQPVAEVLMGHLGRRQHGQEL